jgi:hypothetical protein
MRTWARTAAIAGGGVAAGVASAAALGSWSWEKATTRAVDRLRRGKFAAPPAVFAPEQLAGRDPTRPV